MIHGSTRYEFSKIEKRIKEQLKEPAFFHHLYNAAEGISSMVVAIVKTNGKGWAAEVRDPAGKPCLTDEYQQKYTTAMQPYVPTILKYFQKDPIQQGGDEPIVMTDALKTATVPKETEEPEEEPEEEPGTSSHKVSGPHQWIDALLKGIDEREQSYHQLLTNYPSVYRMEREYDRTADVPIIPKIITDLMHENPALIPTAEALSRLKVPLRTLLFVFHVMLDVARMTAAISGEEHQRKILSIVVALFELSSGDWKKSLLSMVGFFGSNASIVGEYLKICLVFFEMFNQEDQRQMLHGTVDVARNIVMGILASIFQLTAPLALRQKLIPTFDKIAENKKAFDAVLESKGFDPLPDDYATSFDNPVSFLVAISGGDMFHCSCEQQEIVEGLLAAGSNMIKIMIMLLGIPTDDSERMMMCGSKKCKKLRDLFPRTHIPVSSEKPSSPEIQQGSPSEVEVAPVVEPAVEPVVEPVVEPIVAPESKTEEPMPVEEVIPLPPVIESTPSQEEKSVPLPSIGGRRTPRRNKVRGVRRSHRKPRRAH